MPSLKVETPGNLEKIFSLDCFKFNDMKGIFYDIYEHLVLFGEKIDGHDQRLGNIPDFSKIERNLRDLEKQVVLNTKTLKNVSEDLSDHKIDTTNKASKLKNNRKVRAIGKTEEGKLVKKRLGNSKIIKKIKKTKIS